MSRETDSPSSGPNGRGGAAYPSGTPPYGTPVVSDAGADAGRSAAPPEERKTETTLTTRIRINIPGSRPIPPVVVRKPVGDTEGAGADTAAPQTPAAPGSGADTTGTFEAPVAPAPAPAAAPAPAPAAEEKTSDWFAPRKSGPAKGGPGGGTNGAGLPGGPAAGALPGGPTGTGPGALAPGAPAPGARPGAGRPGGTAGPGPSTGSIGAIGTRPGGNGGAGLSGGATGGPVAPGHGGGTGSFDVTEALAAGPLQGGTRPAQSGAPAEPRRDELPYFTGNGQNGQAGHSGQNGQGGQNGYAGPGGPADQHGFAGPGSSYDFNGPDQPGGPRGRGGPQGPAGPTGGPVTGDGPIVPPMTPGDHGMPGGPRAAAPGAAPGTRRPGSGFSDDTAQLTPQFQAPGSGGYGARPADNVSGHTVTSGIPVVPAAGPGGPGTGGPTAQTAPKRPAPAAQSSSTAGAKKKKKGRSKLVLVGALLVVGGVGAYGAGLLMNHSDVPKGTTVLGVDIGGSTRDEAVKTLEDAFDKRADQPLKLSVGGDTISLKPDQAGLQFDIQATVDGVTKSDYNPVSVIGTLFGQERVVEPQMPVDEEKLQAALTSAAGGSGSSDDGTITFQAGKAVAVYGKPGQGVDAAGAEESVVAAYRTQVETGTSTTVTVPTVTKQPTISNAEVDRMMKKFAEPAMSGLVTVRAPSGQSVSFSPQKSLWKFLGVQRVDGKLVETYDKKALTELYGDTFDGVLITRGTGAKTGVTVEDVIGALRPALLGKTPAERTATIDTDPS
ncbi:hypothetical protein [Streptomyces antibioticus]|uniref:hypothetical protein n=1 Tax=Streptomyces antibioticus TaxID=1890 RepID=UPI003D709B8D